MPHPHRVEVKISMACYKWSLINRKWITTPHKCKHRVPGAISVCLDDATAIAHGLHFCNKLQRLDLSSNNISPAGAISLANEIHCLLK